MKILLAIDESPFSEEAIREVEERFEASDSIVLVLHVAGKFVPPAATLWSDAGGSRSATSFYQCLAGECEALPLRR